MSRYAIPVMVASVKKGPYTLSFMRAQNMFMNKFQGGTWIFTAPDPAVVYVLTLPLT
jgi:hypothetical protein